MSAFLRYVFQIFLLAVAIMSGILALLREALSIFAPQSALSRSLFWNCIIIAFIISATILWFQEHRKALSNKPKLNAEFNVSHVAPAGNEKEDSIIVITATITNTGAPSIVQHIKIEIGTEEKLIRASFLPLPQEEIVLQGEDRTFTVKTKDELRSKCLSQPIATGGAVNGWLFLLASGLRREIVFKEGTAVILKFDDVLGKRYSFKKVMSGERIPPPDITKLQKKE
jgi:hypothetical protein